MKGKGVRIACLYSYGCQGTWLLGVDSELFNFISNPKPSQEEISQITLILKQLKPYPTYCSIANLNKVKDVFAEKVVRAYWFERHNFEVLEKIAKLKNNLNNNKVVEKMLDLSSFVTFGRVIELKLKRKRIKILHYQALIEEGKLFFSEKEEEIERGFVDKVRRGDLISVHIGLAREKISQKDIEVLEGNIKSMI